MESSLCYDFLLPLVSIAWQTKFSSVGVEHRDEVFSDAAAYLAIQLARRTYNEYRWDDNHFTYHFLTIVRRQMYKSVSSLLDKVPGDVVFEPSRPMHPREMERHIYLEQLPGELMREVTKKFRFKGRELQACMYVADRILQGARVVPAYLRRDLDIADPQFFVSYVVVLLRNALYDMKLQGSFRTSFSAGYC